MSRPAQAIAPRFAISAASAFEAEVDHVYRTFRRLGAPSAEAEDLAQEVFVVAWRRWSDYNPDRPLRPWLTGIAHRVAFDYFRKRRRQELAAAELEQEDDRPGPDEQLASARARDLALRALALLPEKHRSILIQHDLDGTGIREIAEDMSLAFFTAASRLRRARLKFAKLVKQLQRKQGKHAALLTADAVLRAERSSPALPGPVRARMLGRLPAGAPGGLSLREAPPVRPPVGRSLPLLPVAVALLALGGALALLLWTRGRQTRARPAAAALAAVAPDSPHLRRALPPPRLVPAPVAVAPIVVPGETRGAPADLARGLMGHWRFEDGPGSELARDSSGRGQPCLLHDLDPGTAWVTGPVGGALDLGRTGWLECPLPEARLGVAADLSVAVWIKRTRQRPYSALFARQLPGGNLGHAFWFGLRDDLLTVYGDAWVGWTSRTLTSTSFEGWIHVAFVHADTETRVYVDGVPVRYKNGQLPRGEGVVQGALTIGSARRLDRMRVQHHFDGLVDEARIYDRALTDAEVATLARR